MLTELHHWLSLNNSGTGGLGTEWDHGTYLVMTQHCPCVQCCTICTVLTVQVYTAQYTGSPCHMSGRGGRGPRYAQMIVKYHQQNINIHTHIAQGSRSSVKSQICITRKRLMAVGWWQGLINWSTFAASPVNAEAIKWILIQNYPQSWAHVMWLFNSYRRLKVCLLQHVWLVLLRIHVENCSVCQHLNLYFVGTVQSFFVKKGHLSKSAHH